MKTCISKKMSAAVRPCRPSDAALPLLKAALPVLCDGRFRHFARNAAGKHEEGDEGKGASEGKGACSEDEEKGASEGAGASEDEGTHEDAYEEGDEGEGAAYEEGDEGAGAARVAAHAPEGCGGPGRGEVGEGDAAGAQLQDLVLYQSRWLDAQQARGRLAEQGRP